MTPLEAIKAIKAILDQTDMTEPVPSVTINSDTTMSSGVTLKATPTVIKKPTEVAPVGILTTPATLNMVLEQAKGGDTILLMPGDYPTIIISKAYTTPLTITSANGSTARVSSIVIEATAKNITVKSLSIWRDPGNLGTLVTVKEGATGVIIEDNDIRAMEESVNHLLWDKTKWLTLSGNAVNLAGGGTFRRNKITGVRRAILANKGSIVENNIIDGLTEDGLRGVSNSVFRNNLVKNFFKVDSAHRDAFQSYSGSTVTNLVVEGNTFIGWEHDPSNTLRGDPQGIGMFDGFYENFLIKDNTIVTSHYHGITVLGARNGVVTGNTVVNIDGDTVNYPWIKVSNHKDGRPSENVSISNNRAMSISGGTGVSLLNNETIKDPKAVLAEIKAKAFNPLSL